MMYTITQIADILGVTNPNLSNSTINLLLTDSRSLTFPDETLFFALKTKQNDGHKFIEELYNKGVRNFVIEKKRENDFNHIPANFLAVDNTLIAIQQLAAIHRSNYSIPVVGITGSNGKTVVKEWLFQLLHADYKIVRSPRSFNSQIGVPLSIWQLNEEAEMAIFEAGISLPNEMEALARIINPTIGIITNIGSAHQEGFSSLKQKCLEKIKLFKNCETIIFDYDNLLIKESLQTQYPEKHFIYWSKDEESAPLYISKVEKSATSTQICYSYLHSSTIQVEIPFTEDANIENVIHCIALLSYLKISTESIKKRLTQLYSVAMRLEVKEAIQNCLLIDDTYNLDINSLDLALDFLSRRSQGSSIQRTLILSDLQQTGKSPSSLYKEIAELIESKGIQRLIGIGRDISAQQDCFSIRKSFYNSTTDFLRSAESTHFNKEIILIKGAREFNFEQISEHLQLKVHETILEVDLDAIIHNYNFYRNKLQPTTKMICMVKASGYGAGAIEISKTLQEHRCDYLAVAVADEGADLRKNGIYLPIMVMNPEMSSFKVIFDNDLEPEIYSFRLLKAFIKAAEIEGVTNYPIHIKIDSGMHRLGFMTNEIEELSSVLAQQSFLKVKSIFSHLAGSDSDCFDDFTQQQISTFKNAVEKLDNGIGYKTMHHILNSAGIERFTEFEMDMVRLGIGLYGVSASGEEGLRNVSTLKTTILQIKTIEAGETVGYSRKWKLEKPTKVGCIPIGYADGLDRHLSNGVGEVWVNGKRAPIIGNICMDITMIDLTNIDVAEGDDAIIFGKEIPLNELARKLNTIEYEIITSVSNRVKRIYFRES